MTKETKTAKTKEETHEPQRHNGCGEWMWWCSCDMYVCPCEEHFH